MDENKNIGHIRKAKSLESSHQYNDCRKTYPGFQKPQPGLIRLIPRPNCYQGKDDKKNPIFFLHRKCEITLFVCVI